MGTRKLTRKEIIHGDPIRETLNAAYEIFIINSKVIIIAIAIAVLGVGGYYLWAHYQTTTQAETQLLLSQALKTFHAQVEGEPSPLDQTAASGPKFKSKSQKYTEALKQFQELSNRYGSRPVGHIARYYQALCMQHLGKTAEAVKTLEALRDEVHDPRYAFLVKKALAALYEAQGDHRKAADLYTQLLNDSEATNPKDAILINLGRCYESLQNEAEAIKAYERILNEFPNSLYRSNAEDRLTQLGARKRQEASTVGLNPATGQLVR